MGTHVAILGHVEGAAQLQAWVDALTFLNTRLLALASREGRPLPPLYRSGVRFRPEPREGQGLEDFAPAPVVFARGWGDCDDLAAWRAAELVVGGLEARAIVTESRSSRPTARRWHIIVEGSDGTREDPSARLAGRVSWSG